MVSTYVQCVEDYKFWVYVAGRPHRLSEREITKYFVSGLMPDIFREQMFSRTFQNSDDAVRETRDKLSTYREILDISDRVKKSETIKDFGKDRREFSKSLVWTIWCER